MSELIVYYQCFTVWIPNLNFPLAITPISLVSLLFCSGSKEECQRSQLSPGRSHHQSSRGQSDSHNYAAYISSFVPLNVLFMHCYLLYVLVRRICHWSFNQCFDPLSLKQIYRYVLFTLGFNFKYVYFKKKKMHIVMRRHKLVEK